jgi:hypothetical protein
MKVAAKAGSTVFCLMQNLSENGALFKNNGSRVMGLVGNDVEYGGKYIYSKFPVILSSFKVMDQVHILLVAKSKQKWGLI